MVRSVSLAHAPHAPFVLHEIARKLIVLGSAMALILAGKPLPF
ncbi:hypothetical protein GGQ88_001313 [Novosphingobium hassiacum]|uniref:Uncharacterized protein n=1 Tax=Novosphingobium hassiacum TaxID=173676 RepID=A0A7W5ZVC7_9SPHN|nr:hypothetical protein [Novosphingobium hassiacum]